MAQSPVADIVGDSEEDQPKLSKKKGAKAVDDSTDEAGNKSGEGEGEEDDEEEYEIEGILDARPGMFPEGRMGYHVKWKNYDDTFNSWVDEQDAVNAQVLIDEYWSKKKKVKGAKGKPPVKSRPRKSETRDTSQNGEEPASSHKRKKSTSRRKSRSSHPEEENEDEVEEKQRAKKMKKESQVREATEEQMEVDDIPEYKPMEKYRIQKSWEKLVERVDTIEKVDGILKVFFTLNTGEKIVESSQECAKHFPQKLIQFYESNLRWRETE